MRCNVKLMNTNWDAPEYEVKIQELQQEKTSLMESIKVLSSDKSIGSHGLQPASIDWQPVTSNKSRGKKKKKGKVSSQN